MRRLGNKIKFSLESRLIMQSTFILKRSMLQFFVLVAAFLSVDGSTIISAKCSDGIVIVSDKMSTSRDGSFISNRFGRSKHFMLTDQTVICSTTSDEREFVDLFTDLKRTISKHDALHRNQLSTRVISHIARRRIKEKYKKAHILILGIDDDDDDDNSSSARDRVASLFPLPIRASSIEAIIPTFIPTTMDATSNNDNEPNRHKAAALSPESASADSIKKSMYYLCEILPGGCKIEHDVAVIGTGSAHVASLVNHAFYTAQGDYRYSSMNCGDRIDDDAKNFDHDQRGHGGTGTGTEDDDDDDDDVSASAVHNQEPPCTDLPGFAAPRWRRSSNTTNHASSEKNSSNSGNIGSPSNNSSSNSSLKCTRSSETTKSISTMAKFKVMTVREAVPILQSLLQKAGRFDPRTGGGYINFASSYATPARIRKRNKYSWGINTSKKSAEPSLSLHQPISTWVLLTF